MGASHLLVGRRIDISNSLALRAVWFIRGINGRMTSSASHNFRLNFSRVYPVQIVVVEELAKFCFRHASDRWYRLTRHDYRSSNSTAAFWLSDSRAKFERVRGLSRPAKLEHAPR